MRLKICSTRRTGFASASFLIFNRVIGTGCAFIDHLPEGIQPAEVKDLYRIFATPSVILRSSGSVGLSLVMWLLGALVAACGTAVYIELGTVSIFLVQSPRDMK